MTGKAKTGLFTRLSPNHTLPNQAAPDLTAPHHARPYLALPHEYVTVGIIPQITGGVHCQV